MTSSTNVSGNSIVSSFLENIIFFSVIDVDLIRAVVDFFYDGFCTVYVYNVFLFIVIVNLNLLSKL